LRHVAGRDAANRTEGTFARGPQELAFFIVFGESHFARTGVFANLCGAFGFGSGAFFQSRRFRSANSGGV
jgi:hypothetical protein